MIKYIRDNQPDYVVPDYFDDVDPTPQYKTNPCAEIILDNVKSPAHYTPEEGKIECIDYIRQVLGPEQFIGYCHGNFIKYQHRYKYKGAPLQDLEKAYVYLGWMIETMKGEE